ncbi:MAG: hypothetical protein J0H15_09435 [Xanthomonadales bacterium]|nr:hypothetical protein [Xanthomonadales bacterium]
MPVPQTADPMPLPPEKPDPGDCCGGGCVRCVFDVYEDALERYESELTAWRTRHPAASGGADPAA